MLGLQANDYGTFLSLVGSQTNWLGHGKLSGMKLLAMTNNPGMCWSEGDTVILHRYLNRRIVDLLGGSVARPAGQVSVPTRPYKRGITQVTLSEIKNLGTVAVQLGK